MNHARRLSSSSSPRDALAALALALAACGGPASEGLAPTERRGGARVVFDLEAKPLPEIPLPNDVATRLDAGSPTGRRINVSEQAPTALESKVRERFNRLDGFGTYAPITVRFSRALDLTKLADRHDDADFRDDALFLLNVDPKCKRAGEEIALDLGRGRFPVTLYRHSTRVPDERAPMGYRVDDGSNTLFDFDPRGEYNNLLFEERNEDADGDGLLDAGEDLDGDGRLDVANFDDPRACDALSIGSVAHDRCVADHLLTHYERETNTLIARPLWPLEPGCRHAVVLTKRLVGVDGNPIESPFPFVHHRDQRMALEPALPLLERYGVAAGDIAFAWTFTTASDRAELEAVRAGLYGSGPFARLGAEFPVGSLRFWTQGELEPRSKKPADRVLAGPCVAEVLSRFSAEGIQEWPANRCSLEAEVSAIGALVAGEFQAPNLLVDRDGVATPQYPADEDEIWELDPVTGAATYGTSTVPFWCALPIERDTSCSPGNPEGRPFCKPFPVILYAHGYGGSRFEAAGFMGRTTSMGVAACGVDAYGHGLKRLQQDPLAALGFGRINRTLRATGLDAFLPMLTRGRDRDLDNDGLADSGGDMWSSDLFHTRDMVRQSVLEYSQLVRILRAMDGAARSSDGTVLGDVDGDGKVDLGGPANTVGMWGISLGGVLAGVAAGAEPALDAASPNAGGAGLADIAARSAQAGVPQEVVLPIAGPFIGGCLPTDAHQNPLPVGATGGSDCVENEDGDRVGGRLRLMFLVHAVGRFQRHEFGSIDGVTPGDRVRLENLDNGETRTVTIDPRGRFRVAVAADALSPTERRPLLGLVDEPGPVEFERTPELGDRLRLTVLDAAGSPKATVDRFGQIVSFQGTIYPAGAPLVALQEGLALERNTPTFRRFLGLAQQALGPADPAVWSARYFLEPPDVSYEPGPARPRGHVLVVPTAGDRQVPVNTGIANARTAGLLGSWRREPERFGPEVGWRELFTPDPRFGRSIDDELVARFVVEGDSRLQRFPDNAVNPNVLYDVDDVSDGRARFSCGPTDWSALNGENLCPPEVEGQEILFDVPGPAPGKALRLDRPRGDGSFDGFRVPLIRPAGQHGIYNPQPFRTFDADAYMVSFTLRFLASRGRSVRHESGCDCSAASIPAISVAGMPSFPSFGDRACAPTDLKVCSEACATAWGIVTPPNVACTP
jgi:hypothetical protein